MWGHAGIVATPTQQTEASRVSISGPISLAASMTISPASLRHGDIEEANKSCSLCVTTMASLLPTSFSSMSPVDALRRIAANITKLPELSQGLKL
jgi:hypothetical protein